jgi:ATP-binding cassette subfamily F protein uup
MGLLCTLKNIHLTFGTKFIFKNADLAINEGDRIGLLGLNGKGKSTLFKILTGEVIPDHTTPPFEFSKSNQNFSLFLVPQELPLAGHEEMTIRDYFYIFFPELKQAYDRSYEDFEHLHGWDIVHDYESYLKFFGVFNHDQVLKNLSGGEQKKVLLSLGLSSRANLILWDEPTNHLDIESIKLFEDEMQSTQKAFLLITHDRFLLSKLTNKIFQIKNGAIAKFDGSYTDYLVYLKESEHANMKLLEKLQNNLTREQAWMRQGVKARRTRSKKRVENFVDLKTKVANIRSEAQKALELNLKNAKRQTKVLVRFADLSFRYPGCELLFDSISGTIQKGEKIGLLGKNGVGKTTLLQLMRETLSPTSGIMKPAENLKIQYFSQKREELDSELTPHQVLGDGSDYVTFPDGTKRHVVSYFESFLFERTEIHRPLKTFSGGEKSRLQLALNFTRPGDILIFDEPTNDLDLETIQLLEEKLTNFDGALILISHDRAFLSTITNKVWLIENKSLEIFEGGYEQVTPYLEALELEKELKEAEAEVPKVIIKEKKPITNKEKERLQAIYGEIENTERKTKVIEEKLALFNFSDLSAPNSSQLKILTDAQHLLENQLLSLYEELEYLTSL